MSVTTTDILGSASWSDEADHEWLHQLVGDWQLLADLSFSDLVLWVSTDEGWRAAAHVRPTTGVSIFAEDLVGVAPSQELATRLTRSSVSGQRTSADEDDDGEPVTVETIPVRRTITTVAVLSRHMIRGNVGRRGRLESRYLGLSDALLTMVADGTFPDGGGASSGRGGAPRVGDGVIALDEGGHITYASPNAVSALRRLGIETNALGLRLGTAFEERGVTSAEAPVEGGVVLAGRAPWHAEFRKGSAALMVRAVPLIAEGRRFGAALLLRDITELRRRDRELITKDATIREIHHRVKNNLQTVAAVLRLQARRLPDIEAQRALADAGRRVAVIAAVHETLSAGFGGAVDFDEVAERGLTTGVDVARLPDAPVEARLVGSFGVLSSEDATSLAMVLGELVQNAVEHGLAERGGRVTVEARRDGDGLEVSVVDDGSGLVAGEGVAGGASGLGTQIVRTFVQDLHGTIEWAAEPGGGTRARFSARLRPLDASSGGGDAKTGGHRDDGPPAETR